MPNPFQSGRPVTGDLFADRVEPLATLVSCMLGRQNAVVVSPRRYGKTSLLRVAEGQATGSGGAVAYLDLQRCSTPQMVADEIARAVGELARAWPGQAWMEAARRHFPGLRVSVEHGGYTTSLETQPRRESEWPEVIRHLLSALDALASRHGPASLLLDEFQQVSVMAEGGLPGLFKVIVDEVKDLSLVFSGSSRHLMDDLFTRDAAPLRGTGILIALGLIPEADMVDFVQRRMAAGGKLCSEAVAGQLFWAAHGLPATVQKLGFLTWQVAGRRVTESDVEKALAVGTDLAAAELAREFSKRPGPQQRVLLELAAAGPTLQVFSAEFLGRTSVPQPASMQTTIRRLERDEEIWLTEAGWQVVDCFFAHWLRGRG